MTTRRALSALVALLTALVAALAVVQGQSATAGDPDTIRIVRVVDGDTVVARLSGGDEKVRLIGIDTPETVDPRKPVQCYGKEASNRTKALLPPGTAIRLERDVEARDRYGRLLAYVYRVSDGTFVNLALAEEGFAQPLTIPPNVAYAARFSAAAAAARTAHRGLWAACPAPS
jgi:micrococcal nuclease